MIILLSLIFWGSVLYFSYKAYSKGYALKTIAIVWGIIVVTFYLAIKLVFPYPGMGANSSGILQLIFIVGAVIVGVWAFNKYHGSSTSREFKQWESGDVIAPERARLWFQENVGAGVKFDDNHLPYGRADAFSRTFSGINPDDILIYGFSPIRSLDKIELREYGVLATSFGLLISYQNGEKYKDTTKEGKTITQFKNFSYQLPLAGLWKIESTESTYIFHYPYRTITINRQNIPQLNETLINALQVSINNGLTREMFFMEYVSQEKSTGNSELDDKIRTAFTQRMQADTMVKNVARGFSQLASQNMEAHLNDIQFNAMVNGSQGHGVAAEHANDVYDRLRGREFLKTMRGENTQVGQDNAKHGPDRVVNGVKIQSKYCKTANETVNAYLKKEYWKTDPNMKLEVPRDQYAAAIKKVQQEIDSGKYPELSGKNAKDMLIRGNASYNSAVAMIKAMNLSSLTLDLADGIVESLPGSSISFVLVFAQSRWAGLSLEDAIKNSSHAALNTMVSGSLIYLGSQQFARLTLVKNIAKSFGKDAVQMAEYASKGITGVLVYGPSVVDELRGRISPKQLFKNATVGTVGLIGGSLGSAFGPVGTVGGAMLGSYVSKKVLDQFVEDDAEEMYQIIREEFLDTVFVAGLTQSEFDEMVKRTFSNSELPKIMKEMFASDDSRAYARQYLMNDNIVDIYKRRPKINDEEVQEAIGVHLNAFAGA